MDAPFEHTWKPMRARSSSPRIPKRHASGLINSTKKHWPKRIAASNRKTATAPLCAKLARVAQRGGERGLTIFDGLIGIGHRQTPEILLRSSSTLVFQHRLDFGQRLGRLGAERLGHDDFHHRPAVTFNLEVRGVVI